MILLSLFWELGIKVIVCRMFVDVVHCANIVIDAIEVFSRPQASVSPMPLVPRFVNLILDCFKANLWTPPSEQCQTIQTNRRRKFNDDDKDMDVEQHLLVPSVETCQAAPQLPSDATTSHICIKRISSEYKFVFHTSHSINHFVERYKFSFV